MEDLGNLQGITTFKFFNPSANVSENTCLIKTKSPTKKETIKFYTFSIIFCCLNFKTINLLQCFNNQNIYSGLKLNFSSLNTGSIDGTNSNFVQQLEPRDAETIYNVISLCHHHRFTFSTSSILRNVKVFKHLSQTNSRCSFIICVTFHRNG